MTVRFCLGNLIALLTLSTALAEAAEVEPRPSRGQGGRAGTFENEQIRVGEKTRAFRLVVPEADGDEPLPLVFAYHGLGDNKDLMAWYTRLGPVARREGFALVFPTSDKLHWPLIPQLATEDLEFHDKLYDHLTSQYNIDLNRVYLTGMSNGGYFSHLIASTRPDKIAAIAAHSGGMGLVGLNGKLDVSPKYAVMLIHGDADSIVNVAESRRAKELYTKWNHPIEYIEVPRWNHFWAHNVRVNDKIWKFFEEHPLQANPDER